MQAWAGTRSSWPVHSFCCSVPWVACVPMMAGRWCWAITPATGKSGQPCAWPPEAITAAGGIPFAAYCSDPCDGRSQGTVGMFDSLPYRNDAAIVLCGSFIRSLPGRSGVLCVATCDKGLPASMIAIAGCSDLPSIIVPGGVTLPTTSGEDTAKVQTICARYSHGEMSLEDAAAAGCRACASPGGGCQFLGTAATSQVVAEAMGLTLPHRRRRHRAANQFGWIWLAHWQWH